MYLIFLNGLKQLDSIPFNLNLSYSNGFNWFPGNPIGGVSLYSEMHIYVRLSMKQGSFVFYGNRNVHDSRITMLPFLLTYS